MGKSRIKDKVKSIKVKETGLKEKGSEGKDKGQRIKDKVKSIKLSETNSPQANQSSGGKGKSLKETDKSTKLIPTPREKSRFSGDQGLSLKNIKESIKPKGKSLKEEVRKNILKGSEKLAENIKEDGKSGSTERNAAKKTKSPETVSIKLKEPVKSNSKSVKVVNPVKQKSKGAKPQGTKFQPAKSVKSEKPTKPEIKIETVKNQKKLELVNKKGKKEKAKDKKEAIILLNVNGSGLKELKGTSKDKRVKKDKNDIKATADINSDISKNNTAKVEKPKSSDNAVHKPASIGWKYFLDKKGLPLMKIYTENPGVFFKLEKISDVKKSARYYTHKGDLIGADFIIPNSMIETACTIAGIKTPKNLIVLQSVEQQAAL